jgi:hypothetical protein
LDGFASKPGIDGILPTHSLTPRLSSRRFSAEPEMKGVLIMGMSWGDNGKEAYFAKGQD